MDFQSLVERVLEPVGAMNEDIVYRCPKCEGAEGSGHLYVNYRKGYFNCFKCSFGGKRLESLVKSLGIDISYDYDKIYNEQDKELDNIISLKNVKKKNTNVVDYSTDLEVLTSYYLLHSMPLSKTAYEYLLSRGLTPSLIEKLGIREGVNRFNEDILIKSQKFLGRDYSGRILVPSLRRDGNISFYVARDYTGLKERKYLNPPKELAVASEDVWSINNIESSFVVICEGVFTAISVNKALGKLVSCATYGKSIASKANSDILVTSQGDKLLAKKFNQYIVFYDKDASSEAKHTAKYLYDRGASVRVVNITTDKYGPKADANDMTDEEIVDHIMKAEEYTDFLGLIK